MIAVDTSVVVAAFASWSWRRCRRSRPQAGRACPRAGGDVLGSHASFSSPPRAGLVAAFLAERFPGIPLALPPRAHLRLIAQAASAGLTGGSIHDALIAATVLHARVHLLTRDRRAVATYEKLGVDYELMT